MYIEKIESGFTNTITIGKFANFILTKKDGVFLTVEELFEQCQHFNLIVFNGDEPLLQKEEIGKLCRKLVKAKPDIQLEINTNGLYKPLEMNTYKDNVKFNVFIPLTNSRKSWTERVNEISIQFFIEINSNIIFNVLSKDDVEEAINLISALGIKKSQCFLMSTDSNMNIIKYAKFYGINIAISVEW